MFRDERMDWNNNLLQRRYRGGAQIKLWCQLCSLNVTQLSCGRVKDLRSEIVELEALAHLTGNQGHTEVPNWKQKLSFTKLLVKRTHGVLVQSWVQNITEIDAPAGLFFAVERKHGQMKPVHALLIGIGPTLLIWVWGKGLLERNVSSVSWHKLAVGLFPPAGAAAFQGMQGQRTPGRYWDTLGSDLLQVLNGSLAGGFLPLSCHTEVMTVLLRTLASRLRGLWSRSSTGTRPTALQAGPW